MNKLFIFLAISSAIILASCGSKNNDLRIEPLAVETETVGSDSYDYSQSYVGEIEPRTSTAVSFTGMGTVTRVLVEEGQAVAAGQVIAQMDPTQCRNAVDAAQATLHQAEDAHARLKVLHDAASLSEIDWVEIQTKLQQARSSLEMAKKQLADCTLKAPCSGVIGQKNIQSGQTALPSQPVVTILDISSVKVRASIPEKEIASISSSTPTTITVDALASTFPGGRIEKGIQADPLTHTYDIRILIPNPSRQLLPGMVASVSLTPATAPSSGESSAFTLPLSAIQKTAQGQSFVWVVNDSLAHRKDITLGSTYGNRIEVLSGLKSGDRVITAGYQKVSENTKVK